MDDSEREATLEQLEEMLKLMDAPYNIRYYSGTDWELFTEIMSNRPLTYKAVEGILVSMRIRVTT